MALLAIMLILVAAGTSTSCTREKKVFVVVTPTEVPGTATPVPTPTLTAEQVAYTLSIATQQAQATTDAHATQTAMPTNTPIPPPYKLALVSANCARDTDSYIKCDGFVQNISGSSLKSVQAVAIYLDDGGTPLSSDDALIDYDPIFPNQQSPWSIITRYNPAFTKWRIEFKEFSGARILTRDDRPGR